MSPAESPAAARYDVFLCHNSSDKPLVKMSRMPTRLKPASYFFLDEFSIPPSFEFLGFIRRESNSRLPA